MKSTKNIFINVDTGEGIGNEKQLMPFISLCSIACGGHTGDRSSISQVVELALENQVGVGAHPSFDDTQNFGRIMLDIPVQQLKDSVVRQITTFLEVIEKKHVSIHHIKPHGALYHLINQNPIYALMMAEIMLDLKLNCYLLVPYNSKTASIAQSMGISTLNEAFIDRAYHSDYRLVARSIEGSCLNDPKLVKGQLDGMVNQNKVLTYESEEIQINAQTFCIHGDNPNIEKILAVINADYKPIKMN
ncbi:MAG: LamB/YcsF family protein [Flavobacteriaceae bacterium]|nr:LamB/YcsF family protein [Flavobacteriaceae bacterium]